MNSRMAGVIGFFILTALWAATILAIQTMQTLNHG